MDLEHQPEVDDRSLLPPQRVVGCTVEEFSELAVSTYAALWTLARSIVRTAEDAEDVVQDALITGMRKRGSFTPGTSFLAWMGTIVRLTAMNHMRYEIRRSHSPLDAANEPMVYASEPDAVDPTTGEIDASQQSFDDALTSALDKLSPVARCCLMLRTQHEMDYESIGQVMDIPKNTAMSHVHRARQAIRDLLRPVAEKNPVNPGGVR